VAKRAFRKASVGVLTRETSYPEARETSAELMVSSSVMIVSVHVARTLDGRPGGRAEHTVRPRIAKGNGCDDVSLSSLPTLGPRIFIAQRYRVVQPRG
jgi:hypothetical protein